MSTEYVAPTHEDIAAICKDAFYGARNNGGTMHTAADDAASKIMRLLEAAQTASADQMDALIDSIRNADPKTCGACGEKFAGGHSCPAILKGWESGYEAGLQARIV